MKWDDTRVIQLIQAHVDKSEACKNIVNRIVYSRVNSTKTHPRSADKKVFNLIKRELYKRFDEANFIEDVSAGKMPHKIPIKTEITDERAIVIKNSNTGECTTISENSHIIESLADKIDILRLYVKPGLKESVFNAIKEINNEIL